MWMFNMFILIYLLPIDFRHTITVQHTSDRKNRDASGPNSPPGSPNIPRLRAIARKYKKVYVFIIR